MNPAERMAEAARVADSVAQRLFDPETVRLQTVEATGDGDPDRSIWRDLTLSAGYPAFALLYAELSAYDAPRWSAPLHAYLSAAVPGARKPGADGLFGGHGALAVALRAANTAGGGYAQALTQVDKAVEVRLRKRLDAGFPAPDVLGFVDYDVVGGISGVLRHLLEDLPRNRELAQRAVAQLAELCLRDGERPGWWVTHGPNPFEAGPSGGHGNLGMAHGAAGVLAALAHAGLADVDAPGRDAAVDALADWLLEVCRADAHGAYWPPYVSDDGDGTGKRLSWCYGTPGIAAALASAARLRRRPELAQRSRQVLETTLSASHTLPDAGLCHGWSGLAHTLWRLDANAYRSEIDQFVDACLDEYDPDSVFGFRSAGDAECFDHAGFLEGAAGIAAALHRYARNEPPRTGWDAILMLP